MADEKPKIPQFQNEAEEADWWYANRDWLEEQFVRAAQHGKLNRGSTALRMAREARSRALALTVRISDDDLANIRNLAAQEGQDEESYAGALLHEAITRQIEKRDTHQ